MEKAHPDVFNVLLQVLDDGRLTDGQGRQVSFKNTIIIMTSNVGSTAIAELAGKDDEEMRRQVDEAMRATFRPEFLNRIDDIVVFHPLGMHEIEKIVDIQLDDVRARMAKERMTLVITPGAKQMLAVGGLDPVYGARPLKRLVQTEVVDCIARAIIDGVWCARAIRLRLTWTPTAASLWSRVIRPRRLRMRCLRRKDPGARLRCAGGNGV